MAAPDSLDDESQSLWWRYEPLASLEEMQGGQSLEQVTLSRATEPQVKQSQDSVRSGEGDTNKAMDQECDEIKEGGHNATFAMAVRVNCPIRVLDPKDGVYECHAEGKEAQTVGGALCSDNTRGCLYSLLYRRLLSNMLLSWCSYGLTIRE